MNREIEKLIAALKSIAGDTPAPGSRIDEYRINRDILMRVREAVDDGMIHLVDATLAPVGISLSYSQRTALRSRSVDDLLDYLDEADRWADGD